MVDALRGEVDALRQEVASSVAALRELAPLVLGITGSATQGLVADGLLAAGARPMLTATRAETPTLVVTADALVVNLGSLSSDAREAVEPSVHAAATHGIPWVLDPAAIGAAPVRTPLARLLLGRGPGAVRGNASEVLALHAGTQGGTGPTSPRERGGRGPESTVGPDAAAAAARGIATEHGCVVAVSGPLDLVTDGDRVIRVDSGNPLLTRVSGTGCLLGALTAAHLAVRNRSAGGAATSVLGAVVAATAQLTVAAERTRATGPGSFRVELVDALDAVTGDDVAGAVDLRWA